MPLTSLIQLASRHADRDGILPTLVAELKIIRANGPRRTGQVFKPGLCLVLQGSKEVHCGSQLLRCMPGTSLLVTADLPMTGKITKANPEKPYLCLMVEVEPEVVLEVARGFPAPERGAELKAAIGVQPANHDILDAFHRLLRCLDDPRDAKVLAPMIVRELIYRFAETEHGEILRVLGLRSGRAPGIRRAIEQIRKNYRKSIDMRRLAKSAGFSVASFHRYFKIVSGLSPLQYQKQIRLQEARRRLLIKSGSITEVSYAVGYDSPSQFSREYARLFGVSPRLDRERLAPAR